MRKLISIFKNNKGFILFLFLLFVFRGAVADWHRVPTGSMKPTILEGDMIFVNKLAYSIKLPFSDVMLKETGEPQRGDIVVFKPEKPGKRYIKRLIGLPGDKLQVKDNVLIINDVISSYNSKNQENIVPVRLVDEEPGIYLVESSQNMPQHIVQIKPQFYNSWQNYGPVQVPEGHYFFMGDNRDNSSDSRAHAFTFIPREELHGRASRILLSLNKNDHYKPRSERFGKSLVFGN